MNSTIKSVTTPSYSDDRTCQYITPPVVGTVAAVCWRKATNSVKGLDLCAMHYAIVIAGLWQSPPTP